MVTYHSQIDRFYQYLFIAALFLLPITVLGNNIAIWLITIIWLCSGDYIKKFHQVKANKLAVASIVFFMAHVAGLLWTENLEWGLEILRKMLPFLLVLPILLTIARRENADYYIGAFLVAILISETFSYLIWLGLIEPFKYATISNPTPLMSHVSYTPFLAFAFYLVVDKLFSKSQLSSLMRSLYTFFAITMTVNMFITGGRAGQVMFFAGILILAFQHFKHSQTKAFLIAILLIGSISLTAYNTSPIFKNRLDDVSQHIIEYDEYPNTSIGQRITFVSNSFELFKTSPFYGIGTGDFPSEYKKINEINSPKVRETVQPHNMYMLILVQLGIIGLVSFLWIFYIQFQVALNSNNKLTQHIGLAMPLMFLIIMLSDSYLLGHYTSNLFILFSSFIYSKK